MTAVIRLIRPTHWLKNALVFLPVFFSEVVSYSQIFDLFVLSIALSVASASGYVFNDVIDVRRDRAHPQKKFRPIASGSISIPFSISLISALALVSLILGASLGNIGFFWVCAYIIGSASYTIWAKFSFPLDLVWLSGLYVLRLGAAFFVGQFAPSMFLLSFVFMFFLSLSAGKRYIEMTRGDAAKTREAYKDLSPDLIRIMGILFSGVALSILLGYAVTFVDSEPTEKSIYIIGLPIVLTWWLMRFWTKLSDTKSSSIWDPVTWAARDLSTWVVFLAGVQFVVIAGAP